MPVHIFEVICTRCGSVLHIADTHAGRSGKCTHCGAEIAVPTSAEVPVEDLDEPYRFHAKEYGFGWGLPACWQGWVVFAGYLVLVFGGMPLADVRKGPGPFFAYMGVLTSALVAICWAKGEPLAWRWGERTVGTRAIYRAPTRKANLKGCLVFHVFMGPLMLVVGCWLYSSPPAHMNGTYGYRTDASFRSQDAWDEAQRFSAEVMIGVALVITICQGISIFTMRPEFSLIAAAVIMVLGLIAVIPITESHLTRHFDGQGKRIVRQADSR